MYKHSDLSTRVPCMGLSGGVTKRATCAEPGQDEPQAEAAIYRKFQSEDPLQIDFLIILKDGKTGNAR